MSRRRKKESKKIIYGVLVALLLILGLIFGNNERVSSIVSSMNILQNEENSTIQNTNENETIEAEAVNVDSNLIVDFIDVGQADSILIQNKDEVMLIDAGTNEAGKTVVDYLKNKGISQIDYLIGTHPHEDHIGGMDDVIEAFDIKQIYMPKMETTTKTFKDVLTAISNKNLKITQPNKGTQIELGEAKCEFMTEPIIDKDNINLSSLVIRLEFGNNSFLFMGDAEKENEETITWPKTDVLKVGHHGSNTSSSQEFIEQVQPKYSVIMVEEDNSYNLPKQETIDKLEEAGSKIYRTNENGTIEITSDGNEIKVSTEK